MDNDNLSTFSDISCMTNYKNKDDNVAENTPNNITVTNSDSNNSVKSSDSIDRNNIINNNNNVNSSNSVISMTSNNSSISSSISSKRSNKNNSRNNRNNSRNNRNNSSNIDSNKNNSNTNDSNIDSNKNNSSTNDSNRKSNIVHICNFDDKLLNKVYLDVAVVCEEYNRIDLMCDEHIVNLDEIDVCVELFQKMFYPYKDNFGINRDFFLNNPNILSLISFSNRLRTVNGKPFNLLEELIGNIESDLCVSRNCFTKESLVELTNEITLIKTILDIKCCSLLSSLTWPNIIDIINNYKLEKKNVIPVLIVNIVFKTPTEGVKDTVVRFQYKVVDM
jgi:hypothetical protein